MGFEGVFQLTLPVIARLLTSDTLALLRSKYRFTLFAITNLSPLRAVYVSKDPHHAIRKRMPTPLNHLDKRLANDVLRVFLNRHRPQVRVQIDGSKIM